MNGQAGRGIGRLGRSVVRFGRSYKSFTKPPDRVQRFEKLRGDVLFHSNNTCTRFHYMSGTGTGSPHAFQRKRRTIRHEIVWS